MMIPLFLLPVPKSPFSCPFSFWFDSPRHPHPHLANVWTGKLLMTPLFSLSLSLLTAKCRSQEAGCEHGPISPPSLFHSRLCAVNKPRQSAIPRADCERANSTDVRQQEHDGGMWSATWEVSHSGRHVPWEDVNEGNRSANAERSE